MVTKVMTIDPGLTECGWAVFDIDHERQQGILKDCGVIRCRIGDWVMRLDFVVDQVADLLDSCRTERVVIELPHTYAAGKGTVARNSGAIMKLGALVFSIRSTALMEGVDVTLVSVAKWKGNLPKKITQKRIRTRWGWEGKNHNEADAVGIGDWYIRKSLRFTPGK